MLDLSKTENFIGPLNKACVSICGIGGASELVKDLVRSGLGCVILVDADLVESSNIATQGYYTSDIGELKTSALKRELLRINPEVEVVTYSVWYEELTQPQLDSFWSADLGMMMTDCFEANAKGNLDSLKYKKPALFAGVHPDMSAFEITWNAPDLTSHCHRCVTKTRYDAYESGFKEKDVSPSYVFAGRHLNAILNQLVVSMLHHYRSLDKPVASIIQSLGNRNFLLFKLLPSFEIDNQKFNHIPCFGLHAYEPDAPKGFQCPDCGKTS